MAHAAAPPEVHTFRLARLARTVLEEAGCQFIGKRYAKDLYPPNERATVDVNNPTTPLDHNISAAISTLADRHPTLPAQTVEKLCVTDHDVDVFRADAWTALVKDNATRRKYNQDVFNHLSNWGRESKSIGPLCGISMPKRTLPYWECHTSAEDWTARAELWAARAWETMLRFASRMHLRRPDVLARAIGFVDAFFPFENGGPEITHQEVIDRMNTDFQRLKSVAVRCAVARFESVKEECEQATKLQDILGAFSNLISFEGNTFLRDATEAHELHTLGKRADDGQPVWKAFQAKTVVDEMTARQQVFNDVENPFSFTSAKQWKSAPMEEYVHHLVLRKPLATVAELPVSKTLTYEVDNGLNDDRPDVMWLVFATLEHLDALVDAFQGSRQGEVDPDKQLGHMEVVAEAINDAMQEQTRLLPYHLQQTDAPPFLRAAAWACIMRASQDVLYKELDKIATNPPPREEPRRGVIPLTRV